MNTRLSILKRFRPVAIWLTTMVPVIACAQIAYQTPPREVLDVLNAPATPTVLLSPAHDRYLLIDRERYPSISELAQPMLGLAGLRINPQNRGPHRLPPSLQSASRPSRQANRFV